MRLEPNSTKPLANANPKAFTTLLLTANKGHKPSNCAQAGLLTSTPRLKVFMMQRPCLGQVGCHSGALAPLLLSAEQHSLPLGATRCG